MKFLTAFVHAAAASQLVFNNPASWSDYKQSFPFFSNRTWAMQFRTPSLGAYANDPAIVAISTLTLDHFNFAVEINENITAGASVWLEPKLCPSVNDSPKCDQPIATSRIPIDDKVDILNIQWTPDSPIIVKPSTTYWFALRSSSETFSTSARWLAGDNWISSANDPVGDVRMAYIKTDIKQTTVLPRSDSSFTASLQVNATYYVRGELLLPPAKVWDLDY
ncbi:hypothetical protein AaE_014704 [Aphanomyces astaci]|uniref:Uncharacterized protein n=1 Tax=Aphanomyces astaci TaxID=112090 RepID=A0A6A4Z525_APHAT|nr:hypothetical protein AaE_014704 [Aphanomyces astaci]